MNSSTGIAVPVLIIPSSHLIQPCPPKSKHNTTFLLFLNNASSFTNKLHSLTVINMPPKSGAPLGSGQRGGGFEPRRNQQSQKSPPNLAPLLGQDNEAGGFESRQRPKQQHYEKRCRTHSTPRVRTLSLF